MKNMEKELLSTKNNYLLQKITWNNKMEFPPQKKNILYSNSTRLKISHYYTCYNRTPYSFSTVIFELLVC